MASTSSDPEYDAHLSSIDTRTANRLMALDPHERGIDALGVPLVKTGLTGSADLPDGLSMLERRQAETTGPVRTTLPAEPGIDPQSNRI